MKNIRVHSMNIFRNRTKTTRKIVTLHFTTARNDFKYFKILLLDKTLALLDSTGV